MQRNDYFLIALIFVCAYVANYLTGIAANSELALSWEEACVTFQNVTFLMHRLQFDPSASNFGTYVLFYLAWLFDPAPDLFYGRSVKVFCMSFVAPLAYLYLRTRLRIPRWPAFAASALVFLSPGIIAYSWLATDNGLDALFGLLTLYMASSPRRGVRHASGALMGFTVLCYGGGLAFIPAWGLLVLLAPAPTRLGQVKAAAIAGAWFLAVVAIPLVWWRNPQRLFFGGGISKDHTPLKGYIELARDLFVRGDSYYYLTKQPAFGSVVVSVVVCVSFVLACRKYRIYWPLLLTVATSLVVYGFAGGLLGYRRAVPLTVAVLMCTSVLFSRPLPALKYRYSSAFVLAVLCLAFQSWSCSRVAAGLYSRQVRYSYAVMPRRYWQQPMADAVDGILEAPNKLAEVGWPYPVMQIHSMLYMLDKGSDAPQLRQDVTDAIFRQYGVRP